MTPESKAIREYGRRADRKDQARRKRRTMDKTAAAEKQPRHRGRA